jgi:hypothetical protein
MRSVTRRDFHHVILSALGSCTLGSLCSTAYAADDESLTFVHPELRPFAAQLMRLAGAMPELSAQTLAATRQAMGAGRTTAGLASMGETPRPRNGW